MKLLLTSAGLKNKTLTKAVVDLVGKKAEDINIAFIPTAMSPTGNDKSWFIKNLQEFKEQNYKMVDIVDISALPKWNWQPRLEAADILFVSGGTSPHLMYWIEKSGLKELLSELLKTKVWVGISAGSIVMSPTLELNEKDKAEWYKEKFGYEAKTGLGFIDFYIRPHLNAPKHPHASKEALEKIAKEIPETIYGIDDQMAIKVVDGNVEVVGEGEYLVFNK
jgi:dipeptidase E